MEQSKLDEHIKMTLEKRKLKPSLEAWNRLSEELDKVEKSKKVSSVWWLGIAASFVGILLVVFQFNKSESTLELIQPTTRPAVVKTHDKTDSEQESMKEVEENINLAEDDVSARSLSGALDFKTEPKETVVIEKMAPLKQEVLASNRTREEQNQQRLSTSDEGPQKPLSYEAQKINDIVNEVHTISKTQGEVSETYINALLIEAQKDINREKLINESTGIVDAEALLQDVEAELDESFRTKVFKAIKSSYNSVKTAVANRNN